MLGYRDDIADLKMPLLRFALQLAHDDSAVNNFYRRFYFHGAKHVTSPHRVAFRHSVVNLNYASNTHMVDVGTFAIELLAIGICLDIFLMCIRYGRN